jgi:hypothetical protein
MGSNEDLRWCGERLAVSSAKTPVILFGSRSNGLWRSADGGASWAQVRALDSDPACCLVAALSMGCRHLPLETGHGT